MSFKPIQRDRVQCRSKAKFYSLIRKRRGVSSRSRVHGLLTGCGWNSFIGIVSSGREGSSGGWAGLCCSGSRWQCRAQRLCAQPTAAILNCSVGRSASAHSPLPPSWIAVSGAAPLRTACPAEALRRQLRRLALGTLAWRARRKASAGGTLWASDTRLSTKEKKVRFYYPDSIFISGDLLMGFAGDKIK